MAPPNEVLADVRCIKIVDLAEPGCRTNTAAIGMQGNATITLHALVVRDGKTRTVYGYGFQSGTDCRVHAR